MEIVKLNEKVMIWMFRTGRTQQDLAKQFGITRQAVSKKLKENSLTTFDKAILHRLGYVG